MADAGRIAAAGGSGSRNKLMFLKPEGEKLNKINMVSPAGFEPAFRP